MRVAVRHRTRYSYASPAKSVLQLLRVTPRNHDGQTVKSWRIVPNCDGALKGGEDPFGNLTHTLSLAGPVSEIEIDVEGVVETEDRHGVVRGTFEKFPNELYLRETPLTAVDAALKEFAADTVAEAGAESLDRLHCLLVGIYSTVKFDTRPTQTTTTAAEAFALKRGVCQDLTHIFIACARHLGIPARYVGGHMFRSDGVVSQEAGHAWAEAHVDGLGWVGFDPTNGICPTEAHVRVAVGLDYLGAAPVRGARQGGADEKLSVAVEIHQAGLQRQS
jgi:transglutaminase-like putative cysteine protease